MKNIVLITCLLVTGVTGLFAQLENHKWHFGAGAGMDFTSGTPVPLTGGSTNGPDCSATISDAAGNLLFYSNGQTVWNRLHNVMSNGSGLLGNSNGGQPATIVPHPGNPNLYYLFTCDFFAGSNGLRYSIIDMSQQSGLGAVTATKNVLLYTPTTEKVIAVKHCNRRDYWVITHAWQSNQYRVYLVDNNGLNTTPVVSAVGSIHTGGSPNTYNALGQIAVSKDGSRVGVALYSDGVVEFLDFNNTTGVLSNPVTLNNYPLAWGLQFSDNGNVAYICQWQATQVWQINLLAGNAAAIMASTYNVGNLTSPNANYKSGYMQRGPDGKIYCAKYTSPFLGVINSPNTLGVGCNFVDNGFNLGGPTSLAGLSNCTFQSFPLPDILVSGSCINQFSISDTTDIISVNWNFGDPASGPQNTSTLFTPSHSFTSASTYTVQAVINYPCLTDTLTYVINTSGAAPNAQFMTSLFGCDSTIVTSNMTSNGTTYLWNFGDGDTSSLSAPTHTYATPGVYTITLVANNACGSDTIVHTVNIPTVPVATVSGPDTICPGQTITLTATGGTSIQWSGGSSATTYTITDAPVATTTYIATVSNFTCPGIPDTHTIFVRTLPVVSVSGPSAICPGQNITLTANGAVTYQWSGGSTATTSSINVAPMSTTTYYVTTSDGNCTSIPDTFIVNIIPTPSITIVGPTTICIGQSVTLAATGGTSYQWSGGSNDTVPAITVSPTSTTTYFCTPGSGGCPGISDTITVTVLPAPIVNTSGDVTICAGQSTTLTATGGTSYQWSGGSTDTTASITVSPTTTTTYFVSTSNGPCSSGFDTITVTVIPSPSVTIVGAPAAVCPGTTITLSAVGNATTYVWAGGATGTGPTVTDTPTSSANYYLIGYNSQGCSDTDMVSIGVYDNPTMALLGNDSICVGESTSILCTINNGTYNWAPSTGLSSTSAQSVIANPTTTIVYTVTATDANGCTATDTFDVFVDACIGIQEAASVSNVSIVPNPASDECMITVNCNDSYTIEVVDVLGRVVYQTGQAGGVTSHRLNTAEWLQGVYLVNVRSGSVVHSERLVITR